MSWVEQYNKRIEWACKVLDPNFRICTYFLYNGLSGDASERIREFNRLMDEAESIRETNGIYLWYERIS